jgi:hypothetical protein
LLQGYHISVILACPESFFSEGFPTDPRQARTRAGMTPKTDIQFYDTPQLAAGRFILAFLTNLDILQIDGIESK